MLGVPFWEENCEVSRPEVRSYRGQCGGAEQLVSEWRVSPQISGWQSECPMAAITKSSYDLGVRDVAGSSP